MNFFDQRFYKERMLLIYAWKSVLRMKLFGYDGQIQLARADKVINDVIDVNNARGCAPHTVP